MYALKNALGNMGNDIHKIVFYLKIDWESCEVDICFYNMNNYLLIDQNSVCTFTWVLLGKKILLVYTKRMSPMVINAKFLKIVLLILTGSEV